MICHRQNRSQYHGRFVAGGPTPDSHVDGGIGFAVGIDRHHPVVLFQAGTDGGRLAVPIILELDPFRIHDLAGAINLGCHLVRVQVEKKNCRENGADPNDGNHGPAFFRGIVLGETQQQNAKRDVAAGSEYDQSLHTQQRHSYMNGKEDPKNRTQGIGRVNSADTPLPIATPKQRTGYQRQGHAGAKSRREHHGERDRVAGEVEQQITGTGLGERPDQPPHHVEGLPVHEQRQQRENAHRHLDMGQKSLGEGDPVDPVLDPETT